MASKYNAVPTVVNGWRFDSRKESRRYEELLLLGRAGRIRNLELQPSFPLYAGSDLPLRPDRDPFELGVYRGDFRYEELRDVTPSTVAWVDVVEDVKGFKTALYKWKKKHVEAQYRITVRET